MGTWLLLAVRVLSGLLLTGTLVSGSHAHTWVVEHDPANPVDQVGQAVMAAASGDTVIVGPGRYFEHIPVAAEKSVTVIGRDGAEGTILDGSTTIQGRCGSILYCTAPTGADLTITGFAFENGTGCYDQYGQPAGGAIHWASTLNQGRVYIRDCSFTNNVTHAGAYGIGGAVCLRGDGGALIERCRFVGNHTVDGGDAVFLDGNGEYTVRECVFVLGLWQLKGVWFQGLSFRFEDNAVEADTYGPVQALYVEASDVHPLPIRTRARPGSVRAQLLLRESGRDRRPRRGAMRGNLARLSPADGSPVGGPGAGSGPAVLSRCTG